MGLTEIIIGVLGTMLFTDIVFRPRFDVTKENKLILWYTSGDNRKWIFIKQLKNKE